MTKQKPVTETLKNIIVESEKPVKKAIETFTLTDEDGSTIEFSVQRPNVATYQKAVKFIMNEEALQAGEIVLRAGFCGGDQRVLTDAELVIGASLACASLITIKVFELKKN